MEKFVILQSNNKILVTLRIQMLELYKSFPSVNNSSRVI